MPPRRDRRGARPAASTATVAVLATLAGACGGARAPGPPVVVAPPAGSIVTTGSAAAPAPDTTGVRRGSSEGDRRFLLVAVDDSTVTLLAPNDRWIRRGTYGIAVDPRRRDALVARLYVQSRMGDTAVALVTGQTTRMSTEYAAIFRSPTTPVLRQATFWGGLATGAALGAGLVAALLRGR